MLKFLSIFLINEIYGTTECQNVNNLDLITKFENEQCVIDKVEENSPLLSQDEFKLESKTSNNVVINFEDSKEESIIGPSTFENTETNSDSLINLDMNQVYNETTIKDIILKNMDNDNFFKKHFAKICGLAGIFTLAIFYRDLLTYHFCLKLENSKKVKIWLTIILSVFILIFCIGSSYI